MAQRTSCGHRLDEGLFVHDAQLKRRFSAATHIKALKRFQYHSLSCTRTLFQLTALNTTSPCFPSLFNAI